MKLTLTKKQISMGLILTQLMTVSSFAGQSENQQASFTPEDALLTTIESAKGSGLSSEQLNNVVAEEYKNYDRSAPIEGRLNRLEAAMTKLNIYSANQIGVLDAEIKTSAKGVVENTTTLETELQRIAEATPHGAQFSDCTNKSLGLALMIGGILGTGSLGISVAEHISNGSSQESIQENKYAMYSCMGVVALGVYLMAIERGVDGCY